jgi:hypothetical protein
MSSASQSKFSLDTFFIQFCSVAVVALILQTILIACFVWLVNAVASLVMHDWTREHLLALIVSLPMHLFFLPAFLLYTLLIAPIVLALRLALFGPASWVFPIVTGLVAGATGHVWLLSRKANGMLELGSASAALRTLFAFTLATAVSWLVVRNWHRDESLS